ncbi:beta-glucosidase family protein [Actinotalea subterranea]|uniref:beta-glucosidase family protein n=1 Tax=Actinotalea subterranea TaxID=2607497 RepID=UPI0011EE1326|nr:glycoside hydrolase family 3 C-terminal domain-containing protein [Actinotalea subterranea]
MSTPFQDAVEAIRHGAPPADEAATLYQELTPTERLWLLDGDEPFWEGQAVMMTEGYNVRPLVHGAIDRLGIPGLRFSDGPRGVVMGRSTAFPVSMARGASWDLDLEERVGQAIGAEVAAQGGNFFAGVCINLLRHPAWGRAQETYGEDPVLLGEMGAALTRGVQHHVMACVKHYALNSMENARLKVDVTADDATLHEVYLPHFRRVVDEGVAGVMSAYNAVNGEWAGQNRALLTEILRDRWGFEGVTVSDFVFGIRDAAASLDAGLDVEEPFRQIRAERLESDLASGAVSWEAVELAGLRIIATQLRFAAEHREPVPPADVVASAPHRALAREVAARGMVLLRNETVDGAPVLPLDRASLRRLAVVGRLSDVPNTGDRGSSNVRAPYVVTALAGLRAALPDTEVVAVLEDDAAEAARIAATCDAAIVVAGYTADDEGERADPSAFTDELTALFPPVPEGAEEQQRASMAGSEAIDAGGDRVRLTLREVDEEIIRQVAGANPRTVVTIVAAGAVLTESWREHVPGVVMAWYAGMEGGNALADVLLGAAEPSGRLPFAIPTSEEHLPYFDRDAAAITYDRWHGQRLLDRLGVPAAFPFGFGLSYTTFALAGAAAEQTSADGARVTVTVTNTGSRSGRHVVQVYGHRPEVGDRVLLGFASIGLEPGQHAEVSVPVSLRPLATWDADADDLVLPRGAIVVEAAAHAGDPRSATTSLALA